MLEEREEDPKEGPTINQTNCTAAREQGEDRARRESLCCSDLPETVDDAAHGVRVRGETVKPSLSLELEPNLLFFQSPQSMSPPMSLALSQPSFA